MKLPTVDSCCCCFNLIAGGKFLGWFGIFYGIILIVRGLLNDPLVTLPGEFIVYLSKWSSTRVKHCVFFLIAIGVIVMSAFWLYGIHKVSKFRALKEWIIFTNFVYFFKCQARPSYLLPKMILLFIAICIILIGFIVGNLVLLYFALFSNEPAPHIQKGIKLKTFVFFLGFAAG